MSGTIQETVKDKVIAILSEHALRDPSEITPERSLEELGIDSLGLVETVFAIEEAFDISVPFNANDPKESEFDITNVGTIIQAVENLIAARA